MYLLVLGIALLAMKYLEIGPVAQWSWIWVLTPFGLTVIWWWWADKTGYTRRREEEKMQERVQERLDRQNKAMGIAPKKKK